MAGTQKGKTPLKKVFCWGTFDIIHDGHLGFFKDAKKRGDLLYVIVIHDTEVLANKGHLPKHTQKERITALKKLKIIDKVVASSGDFKKDIKRYALMQPDVFVFGYDQKTAIEMQIMKYFKTLGLKTKFYTSKEFAGGIHTRHILQS